MNHANMALVVPFSTGSKRDNRCNLLWKIRQHATEQFCRERAARTIAKQRCHDGLVPMATTTLNDDRSRRWPRFLFHSV